MQKKDFGLNRLLEIMDELRVKCPWDKKQTLQTLRYLTIEEVYELSDAILKKDMSDPAIRTYLEDTTKLAQKLGIKGTPGFIIGDQIVPGAASLKQLKKFIQTERNRKQ